ncbi:hypothetical protein [Kitasatospora cathayae]|uniref:DUF3592 domain-containing protein n=1 Tax=Kitasatospora cathayae TaxID=3004092 RepID=A0ABY7Q0E0_9ACTN|nr:hypothetical protein [Kitasatospora sp. HUAS 3-15]WBP86075.1 hypothetical protein O1G21_09635 [Kitasatospora sp. HUAS 3-15]
MGAWHEQLRPWLRALILAAAVAGLVGCSLWVAAAYDDVVAFRYASACASGPEDNCVAKVTGTVIDKETGQSCTSDSNTSSSCTTYYRLRLRYGDRTEVRVVSSDTYDDVQRGDLAELGTWRDAVVSLTVRGHTSTYEPPSDDSTMWRLRAAWLVLGVAVWAVVSGRPAHLFAFPNFVWLWLALPISWLVHGALLGAGVLEWIWSTGFAVFGVLFAYVLWREGGRTRWSKRSRRGRPGLGLRPWRSR